MSEVARKCGHLMPSEGWECPAELAFMEVHGLHGLRPWRTCTFCWHMSFFIFVKLPLSDRWYELRYRLRRLASKVRPGGSA